VPTGATARPNDETGPHRQPSRFAVCEPRQRAPFAWQDGRRLWILDGEPGSWILAEMIFDPTSCTYIELRRSGYRWQREAAGALIGRTLAGGQRRAEEAARELTAWSSRAEFR
jgi:hypothetical protein